MGEEDSSDRTGHGSKGSSLTTDSETDTTDVSYPPPPDGGWGWVIVCASFFVHLIADGCAFSFGILFVELKDYFGESKGSTAFVGSLFVAMPLLAGPVGAAVTNRYGCRIATIVGGLIAGTGCVLSYFAPNLPVLCLTFGVIAGFGLSMVYVAGVVVVAFYFEKRRAFATGIAVAGSGIGTFLFAPLIEKLIETFAWRGTLLIIGGIMYNLVLCGALFRPLMTAKEKKHRKYLRSLERFSRHSSYHDTNDTHTASIGHLAGEPDPNHLMMPPLVEEPTSHSLVQFPTYLDSESTEVPPDLLAEFYLGGYRGTHQGGLSPPKDVNRSLSEMALNTCTNPSKLTVNFTQGGQDVLIKEEYLREKPDTRRIIVWRKQQQKSRTMNQIPLHRNDLFYRGSLMRSGLPHGRTASCPDVFIHTASSSESEEDPDAWDRLNLFSKEVRHTMRKMLDTNLLKNNVYLLYCIHSMILYMWYDIPYMYTPDMAIGMGIGKKDASFLISIIGIVSTAGQIMIGYIGDLPQVNALYFYNVLTACAGISTFVVPFLPTYSMLCGFAGVYGFFISGNYSLCTIILVHLLGMEHLTNAYGILMLAEGIANLIGPPLAGWIGDMTHTYDVTFYVAGAAILFSGLMLFAIPVATWCRKKVRQSRPLTVILPNQQRLHIPGHASQCVIDSQFLQVGNGSNGERVDHESVV